MDSPVWDPFGSSLGTGYGYTLAELWAIYGPEYEPLGTNNPCKKYDSRLTQLIAKSHIVIKKH